MVRNKNGLPLVASLTRPFSNAHWMLLVILLGAWVFALVGEPCKEGPYYFEATLAVATLCITLWAADLRSNTLIGLRRLQRVILLTFYDLGAFLVFLFIVVLPIALFLPTYQCYTPRSKVTAALSYGASFRDTITKRAEKNGSLRDVGLGLEIKPIGHLSGYVSSNGTIVVMSNDPAAFAVLLPNFNEGTVKWSCSGFPLELMPTTCRKAPQFDAHIEKIRLDTIEK